MEQKLLDLVTRLGKDIDGMTWADRGITPAQLKNSVGFFMRIFQEDCIKTFQTDAQTIIKGDSGEKTKNSKTISE